MARIVEPKDPATGKGPRPGASPRKKDHEGVHRPGRPVPGEDVQEEPKETVGGQGPAGP